MSEPIMIYECERCGAREFGNFPWQIHYYRLNLKPPPWDPYAPIRDQPQVCDGKGAPVRMFREEDVRPLWETLRKAHHQIDGEWGTGTDDPTFASRACDAFPAPEEWKR